MFYFKYNFKYPLNITTHTTLKKKLIKIKKVNTSLDQFPNT